MKTGKIQNRKGLMTIYFKKRTWFRIIFIPLIVILGNASLSQTHQHQLGKHIEFVQIKSKALTGNRIGDSPNREMAVLLPPGYFKEISRRYPVVYLLHGLGPRKDGHLLMLSCLVDMFNFMRMKELPEIILIAIDGSTSFGGSYFSNSPTIGNFEQYVAVEVVNNIDGRFRTIARREGRALAGFSMGGYGAIKLAMKYNNIFCQLGSLSGSPLSIRYRRTIYRNAINLHKKPLTMKQLIEEVTYEKNWNLAAAYAKASAFSPDTAKPPFFLLLPFESPNREDDDPVWQLWWDDDPLGLVAKYARNLRNLEFIYIDQGDDETTFS